MPLAPNSKLGPYEIKSTLGVGGMGEVYRARDSRLNRDVAIKVLREDGASTDLRSRFEREARAVAALNHPNIIAVYDFGIESGQQYIVSELLDGESLRLLLKGKPLPVRRLIEIAAQVADGLAAAHSAGIVHRDLKPENIMLTKDGRAKILDFGLARHAPTASPAIPPGSDETFVPPTQNLTSAGAILGTAAYMSPEQALGQETDYRSDQFSFGLILYEMASGKQAFARNSSVETMAAIVRDEPSAIEEKIPAPLKWIIDRCLHKEPEQRYESTRDLFHELKDLREHFSEAYTSERLAPTVVQKKANRWKIPAAVGASCLLMGGLLIYVLKPSGQDIGNYRYTPLASDAVIAVWSPDGKAIAYAAKVNEIHQVFLRYLNTPAPVQLTHGKHSVGPLGWSSDKNHVIFLEAPDDPWSETFNIYSVATVGGDPEFIMKLECKDDCVLSRDGETFATRIKDKDGYFRIAVSNPLGSPLKVYSPDPFASKADYGGAMLAFAPDGKKMLYSFVDEKGLPRNWLLPYPAGSGPPQLVLQKLGTYGSLSWMPDSRNLLISIRADANAPRHVAIANISSGVISPLTTGTADEDQAVASPDGKGILYTQLNGQEDIISVSLVDGTTTTLISTGHREDMAAWSATQAKLAWATNRSGSFQIWMRAPDGSERPVVTAADFPGGGGASWLAAPSLSSDGERLIYDRFGPDGGFRLWISSLSGGSPVRLTDVEPGAEYTGAWSPDGSRFVYLQSQGGKTSVMVTKTNGNAAPVMLKEGVLPSFPDWSPTGDWITYRDQKGWSLVSPDGKRSKFLGNIQSLYLAFARDGKLLYGIQTGRETDRATLFSLDPVSLKQTPIKELGKNLIPAQDFTVRFSLAPDGKSFVYSVDKDRSDLWMLQGYRQPGLWNQIKDAFHFSKSN